MTDVIVFIIIAAIIISVIYYMISFKKKNKHGCIGCPNASQCGGKNCHSTKSKV